MINIIAIEYIPVSTQKKKKKKKRRSKGRQTTNGTIIINSRTHLEQIK